MRFRGASRREEWCATRSDEHIVDIHNFEAIDRALAFALDAPRRPMRRAGRPTTRRRIGRRHRGFYVPLARFNFQEAGGGGGGGDTDARARDSGERPLPSECARKRIVVHLSSRSRPLVFDNPLSLSR